MCYYYIQLYMRRPQQLSCRAMQDGPSPLVLAVQTFVTLFFGPVAFIFNITVVVDILVNTPWLHQHDVYNPTGEAKLIHVSSPKFCCWASARVLIPDSRFCAQLLVLVIIPAFSFMGSCYILVSYWMDPVQRQAAFAALP